MTHADCCREPEIVEALTAARWPARCDAELVAHVAECAGCTDLVVTWPVLADAWEDARAAARLPTAGTVWWRAQMRARREAAHTASGPVTVAQAVAAAAGLVSAGAALALVTPWLQASLASGARMATNLAGSDFSAGGWAAAGAGTVLALATLAVYLVVAED